MVVKHSQWLSILAIVLSVARVTLGAAAAGKTFPTLAVGMKTYTNVTITDISGNSVFLRHSRGFESIQIDSLSPEVQQQLGLQAAAPERRPQPKAATESSDPSHAGGASAAAPSSSASASGNRQWKALANDAAELHGIAAVLVYGSVALGMLLLLIGQVLFIVAAFQTGPWWGVGVLFGGLTCGIVPVIFFFTHLEQCKKAFLCGASGFALFVIIGIAVPNFARAKAVKAKENVMLFHEHAAQG